MGSLNNVSDGSVTNCDYSKSCSNLTSKYSKLTKEFPRGRPWMKDGHFTAGRDEYMPIPQPQINYSFGVYKQNVGY